MARNYNNFRPSYNQGFSNNNQPFVATNNYNGNFQGYTQNNQPPKKKTGFKIKIIEGKPFCSGWKLSGGALVTLYARPYKGTKEIKSKNGKVWLNLFVTLTNKSTLQTTNMSGMYDMERRRLYIKDLNLVGTTNGRGGYFGKHISKSY